MFLSYFTAIDCSFPQAYFFSKCHHGKCCCQTPFKFHVYNLEEHEMYTVTISLKEWFGWAHWFLVKLSRLSQCYKKWKTAYKMSTHLVAADIIVALVDAAAIRPKLQGLRHWLNVWVRVGAYHADRPACVTLTRIERLFKVVLSK